MAGSVEVINVDTAFDLMEKKNAKGYKWTVSLGDPDWPKNVLLLLLHEENEDGETIWARYGRVDALRRSVSNPTKTVLVMTSWTEATDIWELDPKEFYGPGALCNVDVDIDNVISTLRSAAAANDWLSVRFLNVILLI